MFSCEFYEISKNTFFYRTPLDDWYSYYLWCSVCYLIDASFSWSKVSSRRRCSSKKKKKKKKTRQNSCNKFVNFTGVHLCHSLLLNKVTPQEFTVNLPTFFRIAFLQNNSERLVLVVSSLNRLNFGKWDFLESFKSRECIH